jgi:hypothetical protein
VSLILQFVFTTKLRITSDKKAPFKEENPINCCFSVEELIKPEIVPPVPTAQAMCVKNDLSSEVKISSQPFMAKSLVPPSGIK